MHLDPQHLNAIASQLHAALLPIPEAVAVVLGSTMQSRSRSMQVVALDQQKAPFHPSGLQDVVGDEVDELLDHIAEGLEGPGTVEIAVARSGRWWATAVHGDPKRLVLRPVRFTEQPVALPALTDDDARELQSRWEAGAASYRTQPGATDEQLHSLATALGQPVPPQLAALLRLSNGADVAVETEEEWSNSITAGWSLLSTEEVATQHRQWSELAADGPYQGVAHSIGQPGAVQPRLAHPGWVPFAHDFGGNHLGIDTVPGPAGTPGQVVEFGRDLPDGAFVRADSLVDFLAGRRHQWPDDPAIDHRADASGSAALTVDDVPGTTQALRLFNFEQVAGSVVATATQLKSLLIRNTRQLDLSGLNGLPLQEISLIDVSEVDLGPLAGHPTLRLLGFEDVGTLVGHDVLASLPALEEVSFGDDAPVEALAAAGANPNVAVINLGGYGYLPLKRLLAMGAAATGISAATFTASGQLQRGVGPAH